MKKLALSMMLSCIIAGAAFADVNWNVESGVWSNGSNWNTGVKPDNSTNINVGYSGTSVCTLDTDEGLFSNSRLYVKNGQTLNIVDGGLIGTKWTRWGDGSAGTVNFSGNGTYVLNNDDLYFAYNGDCVVTMSDTSTITVQADDGDTGEELYIGNGGDVLFQLNGSGLTIEPDRIHIGYHRNSTGGNVTLEYVLDTGGLSAIVVARSYIGDTYSGEDYGGTINLVLTDPGVTLPEQDLVLVEATEGYGVGGPGVFDTMNGGPATEGSLVVVGGNVYSLTYTYEADADGNTNDIALVFVQSAKNLATDPVPANGSTQSASPTTLEWINPDPNDGVSDITCTVYFGMAPADPNRTGMDWVTLAPNENSVEINATNFETYGAQPIEDANDFYWVVDCVDASPDVDPALGKAPLSWSFSTLYNAEPVVSAGNDQIVYGDGETYPTVNLEGSASDPDSGPETLDIEWTIANGPETAVINPSDNPITTVTITESGVYVFELTAYDGLATISDTVQVVVGIDSCEASFLNGEDYNDMDFDTDCDVDLVDFADFAADWLACTNTIEGC